MNASAVRTEPFFPVQVSDFELTDPTPLCVAPGSGAALTIRLHGVPLGMLVLDPARAGTPAETVTKAAAATFAGEIRAHLSADGLVDVDLLQALSTTVECSVRLHPREPIPTVSVVLCTLGADERLPQALQALLDQDYPAGHCEIVLVDNDPGSGRVRATMDALDHRDVERIVYVSEPVRGLPTARNSGIAAATGTVVAFTDDDVIIDPGWVRVIAAVMTESPIVDAITGLVLPASLETRAEQVFEVACGFDKGYERRVWTTARPGNAIRRLGPMGTGGPLFPFSVGRFGTGANMAFRAETLDRIGGFDPAMTNSEDIDILFRIIFGGGVVVYEPQAVVRHYHENDSAATAHQMRNYGVGFSAFLTKQFLHTPGAARQILALTPTGVMTMARGRRNQAVAIDLGPATQALPVTLPRDLGVAELRGLARGPFRYLSVRHRLKKASRS
ncbi:MAG: glycosyltransferase [Actinomycetes bacterium]